MIWADLWMVLAWLCAEYLIRAIKEDGDER